MPPSKAGSLLRWTQLAFQGRRVRNPEGLLGHQTFTPNIRWQHGPSSNPSRNRRLAEGRPRVSQRPEAQPRGTPSRHVRSIYSSHRRLRWASGVGAEPGIDPKVSNPKWDRLNQLPQANSDIKVIDYSEDQIIERDVTSSAAATFFKDEPRPSWAACRWVYVNGINWHVIKSLGSTYNLHPLALEDAMDTRSPTKVDWYQSHCFLEMNMARLVHIQDDDAMDAADPSALLRRRHGDHKWRLLSPGHFGMSVEQVSIFMTDDNTIITIFENSGQEVLAPILARLQSTSTVVRSSNDPSMLLQAIIDAVVDLALPIGKAVSDAFDDLELAVLSTPKINQSQRLHILRSGLTLLREHTIAVESLIRALSDHRQVLDFRHAETTPLAGSPVSSQVPTSVQISPMAQVYLQDVRDHAASLSNSTAMAIRSAEHLTSLIFNSITASQNESVRKLTLVSCFFLPLTFLTGEYQIISFCDVRANTLQATSE